MIDQTRLDAVGIKVEKKLFPEDVADSLEQQMIKLRLLAALNVFDDPKDRNELLGLADKVEEVWNGVLSYLHG